jgi:hypothetical protein
MQHPWMRKAMIVPSGNKIGQLHIFIFQKYTRFPQPIRTQCVQNPSLFLKRTPATPGLRQLP